MKLYRIAQKWFLSEDDIPTIKEFAFISQNINEILEHYKNDPIDSVPVFVYHLREILSRNPNIKFPAILDKWETGEVNFNPEFLKKLHKEWYKL